MKHPQDPIQIHLPEHRPFSAGRRVTGESECAQCDDRIPNRIPEVPVQLHDLKRCYCLRFRTPKRPQVCSAARFRILLGPTSQYIDTMASIARQSLLSRHSCLSAFRSPLVNKNVSQVVAFHASAKKQILPPLPRELLFDLFMKALMVTGGDCGVLRESGGAYGME